MGRLMHIEHHYSGDESIYGVTDCSYSEDGKTVTALKKNISGEAIFDSEKTVTVYDAAGRVESSEHIVYSMYDLESGLEVELFTVPRDREKTSYYYDELGRVSREVIEKGSVMNAGDGDKYYDVVRIDEIIYEYADGWAPLSKKTYSDVYQHVIEQGYMLVDDAEIEEELYTYNEEGECIHTLKNTYRKSFGYFGDSSTELINVAEYYYETDENGRVTKLVDDQEIETFAYDSNGNIVDYKFYSYGELRMSEIYTYDNENRLEAYEIKQREEYGYAYETISVKIVYDAYGRNSQTVTSYVEEGISIIADYSFAKKADIPVDVITYDLISWFETAI